MNSIKTICMLSVHGYFDPEPILGATDTGGQVTYVLELAKHLSYLGPKVDIYTRQFEGRSEIAPVDDKVRVIRIPCGPDKFIRKEDLFPLLDEFVANMGAFIEKHGLKYDVYHSHYWDAGYAAMKLCEINGQPFVHTAHSLGAWKKEQMGGDPGEMEKLFKFEERIHWENITFRRAAAQTVTTKDGLENYKRLYDFESPDLAIIPPGVDTKRFRPLRDGDREPDIEIPGKYVFALSRIDSNKGLDCMINAFALIHDKCGVHLLIGGGSKNPKQHEIDVKAGLAKLVKSHNIQDKVKFTGYIPDDNLPAFYRNAEVFVLPSKYEPFGMTVLEAMSCGTPVIATRFGGIRDNLSNNTNSLLVDPSDAEEFSSALLELVSNRDLASKLGAKGMETIRMQFSWESIASATLDFYDKYFTS